MDKQHRGLAAGRNAVARASVLGAVPSGDAVRRLIVSVGERERCSFHPTLLLLSAFLAGILLNPINAGVFFRDVDPDTVFAFAVPMGCSFLATSAALFLFSVSRPSWQGPSGLLGVIICVCYAASQATVAFLLPLEGVDSAVWSVLGVATGFFVVAVVLNWIRRFRCNLRTIIFHGALSAAVAMCLLACGLLLSGWALSVFQALLCLIGSLASLIPHVGKGFSEESGMEQGGLLESANPLKRSLQAARSLVPLVWIPFTGMLVYLFLVNFSFDQGELTFLVEHEAVAALLACAIALVVCLIPGKANVAVMVNSVVVPICAACCLLPSVFPDESTMFYLGAYIIHGPLIFLSIYTLSCLVAIINTGEYPLPFIAGVSMGVVGLAAMVGLSLSKVVTESADFRMIALAIIAAYFSLVILNLGISLWRSETRREGLGDDSRGAGHEEDGSKEGDGTESEMRAELYERRIERLAEEKGLTSREAEILMYLGRGQSSTYIASCLFISANTVRFHVRNIYGKLNVASRAELLSMVNE